MKKVIIYGLGVSGKAMYELLKNECSVLLFDDGEAPQWAKKVGVLNLDEAMKELTESDALLLSPSIRPEQPLVKFCVQLGKSVIGELELGVLRCKSKIVAVTGTNGKTTTVSLITHILGSAGKRAFALGNIGKPLCSMCDEMTEEDIAVLEVSSFQLESIKNFSPYISAVLNVTPDHIDWHKSFENYVSAKTKILTGQGQNQYCILNADDAAVADFSNIAKAKSLFFSTKHNVNGCFLQDGKMILATDNHCETILDCSLLRIKGVHNVYNAMCAALVCHCLGLAVDEIRSGLLSFGGVEHRLESVGIFRGVEFVNDSKSTNVDSTLKAVNAFSKDIFLILGGRDKGLCFGELFEKMPRNIKKIAIIGEASEKICKAADENGWGTNYFVASDMEDAVKKLICHARSGDIILLSPACASFDAYRNYVERGNHFKKIVGDLDEIDKLSQ